MTAVLILLGVWANSMFGLVLMGYHDDGRVIRWCARVAPGPLLYPMSWFVACFWPICLWIIYRKR